MATGLHHTGDWQQAVEYYLKLFDLDEAGTPGTAGRALEKIERSLSCLPRLLGAGPAGHASQRGGAAAAAAIDHALERRLEEAKMDTSTDTLKRFIAFFGNQPQAAPARAELLQRLTKAGQILEAELLLAAAARSPRSQGAGRLAGRHGRTQFRSRPLAATPPRVSASFSGNSPMCPADPDPVPACPAGAA